MKEHDGSDMLRNMPFPFEDNRFPAALGAVVQRTVLNGDEPARIVAHAFDGSWMVGDGVNDPNEPDTCVVTHIAHVVRGDASLEELATLPPGKMAQRDQPGDAWQIVDHVWAENQ